jgi:hypothetical protein
MKKSHVHQAALEQYFDGPEWESLLVKRLQSLERKLDELSRNDTMLFELLHALTYFTFLFQPKVPESESDIVRARAQKRLEHLKKSVRRRLQDGDTFVDVLRDAVETTVDFRPTG